MLGVATSTDNFQAQNTSPLAFEMAGILMRSGAIRPQSQPQRRKMNMAFEEKINEPEERVELPQKEVVEPTHQAFEETASQTDLNNPPEDWLEPKIYKGSTSF
jgi:hypothetical protein